MGAIWRQHHNRGGVSITDYYYYYRKPYIVGPLQYIAVSNSENIELYRGL